MQAKGIRKTPLGYWEVTYSQGGKRRTRNFKDEQDAIDFKLSLIPPEPVEKQVTLKPFTVGEVVQAYLDSPNTDIAPSTAVILKSLTGIKSHIHSVDAMWVDGFITRLKDGTVTPQTIRNKVNALSTAVDWWVRVKGLDLVNPLKSLGRGYANYKGGKGPKNVQRDFRLNPGDYEKIVGAINKTYINESGRPFCCKDPEDFKMLFELTVDTGMRLREVYRLKLEDLKINVRAPYLIVQRSKMDRNGVSASREVPIKSQLLTKIKDYLQTKNRRPESPVLPYWTGVENAETWKRITGALSNRYQNLFNYCGLSHLTEHDLRHEGICRWLEMKTSDGNWLFRSEEVMKISGHKTLMSFSRYVSFQGNDLAAKLHG